jgi:hypothetical protein
MIIRMFHVQHVTTESRGESSAGAAELVIGRRVLLRKPLDRVLNNIPAARAQPTKLKKSKLSP